MHLGPLRGRDPGLARVTGGFVSNPMLQAEASKIPLCTIGEYLRDPQRYDPDEAWSRALLQVAGTAHEPLRRFAETSLASCLQAEQAPRMTMLAAEARDALESLDEGRRSRALATLADYCDALDESCYSLKHGMSNLKLRDDILPWIEALEAKLWLARHAVKAARALAANEPSGPSGRAVFNILHEIEREPKSIGGAEVVCFATHVADMILKHEATTDAGSDERTVLPHAPLREDGADT
jgi:hyaluronoglucosaminidase